MGEFRSNFNDSIQGKKKGENQQKIAVMMNIMMKIVVMIKMTEIIIINYEKYFTEKCQQDHCQEFLL